jgi:hypothetical protein
MTRLAPRIAAIGAGAILVGAFAPSAQPAEVDYQFDIGAGASDNIARLPENEEETTFGTAGLQLLLEERRRKLTADVVADLQYLDYLEGDYESEVVGNAVALALLDLIPERFQWSFEENYGQTVIDPFESISVLNREYINYFTTGPDFSFALGSAMRMTLFTRYSRTDYEVTDTDGNRFAGGFSLGRPLTARTKVSLNAMTERVEFDSSLHGSYDRRSAFVRYQGNGVRTRLLADLGYNGISSDDVSSSRPLARLNVSRNLSPAAVLFFEGSIRFSNSSDAFRDALNSAREGPSRDSGGYTTATADPFETRRASLGLSFNWARTSADASVSFVEDGYATADLFERKANIFEVHLERQLRPTVRVNVFADRRNDQFINLGLDDDESRAGIEFAMRFGRHIGLRLGYENFRRSASDPARDFKENRARLSLTYAPARAVARQSDALQ